MIKNDANPTNARVRQAVPGPTGYPVIGVLPKMWEEPLQFFVEAGNQYGDVVHLDLGPRKFYLLNHPDHIQYVLQDNYRNYHKGYDPIEPLIGNGLVMSEGDFWRRQRRLMQPAFHRDQLALFADVIAGATAEMLTRWERAARHETPLDIAEEMTHLTLRVILRTMFSTDIHDKINVASQAFEDALAYMNQQLMAPFEWLQHIPTPAKRRFQRALTELDDIVYGIIAERRHSDDDPGDLLSMLLNAQDEETGESMTDKQVRDEVMTIFLAGHETTANALAWVWYLLSKYPATARQVRTEVDDMLGNRTPAYEDLQSLTYMRMVVDETLRLYPSAWMFARQAVEDDEIGGYSIPSGATLMLSPYVTHRRADFWVNPEGFDPERFTDERAKERPRYAYFPFGGGPRRCIGEGFALMEAQLVIAMVVQRYRLALVPGYRVEPQPMATLRPHPGILMTVHES